MIQFQTSMTATQGVEQTFLSHVCICLFQPCHCLVLQGYVSRALDLQKSARFKDRDGGASDVAVLNASLKIRGSLLRAFLTLHRFVDASFGSSVAYDAEIVKFAWCKPGQKRSICTVCIAKSARIPVLRDLEC